MKEIWREIEGFNQYEVSNLGNVRHKTKGMKIQTPTKKGYLRVALYDGKRNVNRRVHRLVAEAFIPNPEMFKEVNHIDEDKSNNRADNLEWCSRKQNIEHSIKSGKFVIKSVEQIDSYGKVINRFVSASEAERATGIPRTHICKCALGRYGFKTAGGFSWKYAD